MDGRVTHLTGLPHLRGVHHLHENRHLILMTLLAQRISPAGREVNCKVVPISFGFLSPSTLTTPRLTEIHGESQYN